MRQALLEQYRRARYEVFPFATWPGFELTIDTALPRELECYLASLRARTFTFLTAYNPRSVRRPREWNRRRQRMLVEALLGVEGVRHGAGRSRTEPWCEPSLLVPGWSEAEARTWGGRFGQLAVLWGEAGGAVQLVTCDV